MVKKIGIEIDWGPVPQTWQDQLAKCCTPIMTNADSIRICGGSNSFSNQTPEVPKCSDNTKKVNTILWCEQSGGAADKTITFFCEQANYFLDATLVKGYADVLFPHIGDRPSDLALLIEMLCKADNDWNATGTHPWRLRGFFSGLIKDYCAEYALLPGNVLIFAPSGTGKEGVAKLIHRLEFGDKPFIGVSLSTVTDDLFPSLFFGIENNVATGVKKSPGFIEQATGGTLFLDEIADITPRAQQSLLRVLSENSYTPVGGKESKKILCRIISATNRYKDMRNSQYFRQDLRMRLEQTSIVSREYASFGPMRSLVDVRAEIPFLFAVEIVKILRDWLGSDIQFRSASLSEEVCTQLMDHCIKWEGNHRALHRTARSAMLETVREILGRDADILTSIANPIIRKKHLRELFPQSNFCIKKIKTESKLDGAAPLNIQDALVNLLTDAAQNKMASNILTPEGMGELRKAVLIALQSKFPDKSASALGRMIGVSAKIAQNILKK